MYMSSLQDGIGAINSAVGSITSWKVSCPASFAWMALSISSARSRNSSGAMRRSSVARWLRTATRAFLRYRAKKPRTVAKDISQSTTPVTGPQPRGRMEVSATPFLSPTSAIVTSDVISSGRTGVVAARLGPPRRGVEAAGAASRPVAVAQEGRRWQGQVLAAGLLRSGNKLPSPHPAALGASTRRTSKLDTRRRRVGATF
mmetsp:Transcript_40263/g.120078  ORF Transcript_40263/g.120078 Transcript_40263/m.120078 type:complete len:201 (-) Transcript_40263:28-630(-)